MNKHINKTKVRVRYCETDQMGIVHHSNYICYFEIGRTQWLRDLGLSYNEMEKTGIMLPVIDLKCHYKKSAYYDDLLTIETSTTEITKVRIGFAYKIYNQNNELITTGETTLVFLDKNTKKPMRCTEDFYKNISTSI